MIEISPHDTKVIKNPETGEEQEVMAFIPQCCREGWDTCQHVPKKVKPKKKNIGL